MSREEGARILTQFETHLQEGYCRILPVRTRDYRMARSWLTQLQDILRTLDALYLAVAESSGASTLTADKRLAAEAQALGLSVKLLTITPRR
ncbi:hypothetical protein W02_40160 [Nitrospira sp. KM1]|uniref:type II toxin-antitoxin system VapC family toxin n=1 Tax=Nitrospira sp. KM1 TaxID=1936990 RepID=UPI0013A75B7E|nr:type II toxin-antitoxin system VapC family toxin [Nitrospira sp. KM1]BCA56876.1 hypothetical protein W02_40160 [Nitrospira sp. KM1]